MPPKKRWAILISGRGSNLAALLDTRDEAEIRLVVSSSSEASGLLKAKRAGVETRVTPMTVNAKGLPRIDWTALDLILRTRRITHIFLAGFMKVVPASFVEAWAGRILNLHPSLLPKYPGLDSISRAFVARDDLGLSVHEVTREIDAGQIILQRRSLRAEQLAVGDAAIKGGSADVTPSSGTNKKWNLARAELRVHIDEQRAVKETIRRWNK